MLKNRLEQKEVEPSLIVSGGDPLGVGPYLIAYALVNGLFPDNTYIVCTREVVNKWYQELGGTDLSEIDKVHIVDITESRAWTLPEEAGWLSYRYLSVATSLALKYHTVPLLTLPINKYRWRMAHVPFVGHTEFFKDMFPDFDPIMAMKHKNLFVIAITDHIPLKEVIGLFNNSDRLYWRLWDILKELKWFKNLSSNKVKIRRVAITGLNPHAGEVPALGTEEREIMLPVIKQLREHYPEMEISDPLPADSFWGMGMWKNFDVVLAPYHDQAFIPFKILVEGRRGIHMTLGLPIFRISPIHGTADEAVRKRQVNPDSFLECLEEIKHLLR